MNRYKRIWIGLGKGIACFYLVIVYFGLAKFEAESPSDPSAPVFPLKSLFILQKNGKIHLFSFC